MQYSFYSESHRVLVQKRILLLLRCQKRPEKLPTQITQSKSNNKCSVWQCVIYNFVVKLNGIFHSLMLNCRVQQIPLYSKENCAQTLQFCIYITKKKKLK